MRYFQTCLDNTTAADYNNYAKVELPDNITKEDCLHLEEWFALILRQTKRLVEIKQ